MGSPKMPKRFWMVSGSACSLLMPGILSKIQLPSRPMGKNTAEDSVGSEMPGRLQYFWASGAHQSANLMITTVAMAEPTKPRIKLPVVTYTRQPAKAKCQ